jgi:antitoxin ParD1/3/4
LLLRDPLAGIHRSLECPALQIIDECHRRQLEKFVSDQVQSGAYQSASEVVREGLRLLVERRKTEELKLAALRAAIREGLDSGPAEPFDMEAIIAEARAGYQRRA